MIREAYEEAGITLLPAHLRMVHIIHRRSKRLNIDIFFECNSWEGEIINKEPHKCAALEYFPIQNLPTNTINYIVDVLQAVSNNQFYSEKGWKK